MSIGIDGEEKGKRELFTAMKRKACVQGGIINNKNNRNNRNNKQKKGESIDE